MRLRAPPAGFVALDRAIPGLALELGYASAANFTGAPLPGYGAAGAWLLEGAARSLGELHAELGARGLGLICFDAYRPRRATLAMVAWAERTGHRRLLDDGFISATSWHNRGVAVDVGLVDLARGERLDLGTAWDTFTPASRPENAVGPALERRRLLQALMTAHGWKGATTEWWHFRFLGADSRPRDVPYGAQEADEPQ